MIIQQPVTQSAAENLTTTLADNTTNNNSANNNNSNIGSDNSKKKRRKWFPRWLAPVRFKKKQEKGEEQREEQRKKDRGQQHHVSLGIAAMREEGRGAGEGGTPINNDITDQQLQQQRYSSASLIGTSTITPATTIPPVFIPPRLQRNSWAAPETSYQQYQNEKLELLQEGLCGLNNVNILHALGEHNRAVTGGSGRARATTSMIILSSQPQQQRQRQLRQQEIKRDSGVSFITQQQQANNSNNNSNNKTRRRFSARLRSVREQDEQEQQEQQQQQQQQQQQHNQLSNTSTLIGFRYPRMVHRQTLRDAAIHVLSSEISLYESEDYFNDNGYVDERNVDYHDQGMNINRRQQQQEYIQGIGRVATLGNRNSNSIRQQCYQPRNKRFSDPGLVLYSR